jgi:hypothetical protein
MCRVKATQQMLVHPLARYRHSTRRVEPIFEFGISDERGEGRRPEIVIGCGRHPRHRTSRRRIGHYTRRRNPKTRDAQRKRE